MRQRRIIGRIIRHLRVHAAAHVEPTSRSRVHVPPGVRRSDGVCFDGPVVRGRRHGVERPRLVVSRIHGSKSVVSGGRTFDLPQQSGLMVHVRVVGYCRAGCSTREIQIATVGSRRGDTGAGRHHRSARICRRVRR